MNESTLSATPVAPASRSRDRLLVGLVAGALLVAAVGAAAGWLLRGPGGAPEAVAAVEPVAQRTEAPAPARKPATKSDKAPSHAAEREPLLTQPVASCHNCGTVEGVRSVEVKGEGTGLGAAAGAVLGGVLGHQVGGGNGKKAMTVVGAVGGGVAGHEVEKRARSETVYEVRVRMDDGSLRTVTQKTAPTPGARVAVAGTTLRSVSTSDGTPQVAGRGA
jgi:outer membrane lipoprotein SlyB